MSACANTARRCREDAETWALVAGRARRLCFSCCSDAVRRGIDVTYSDLPIDGPGPEEPMRIGTCISCQVDGEIKAVGLCPPCYNYVHNGLPHPRPLMSSLPKDELIARAAGRLAKLAEAVPAEPLVEAPAVVEVAPVEPAATFGDGLRRQLADDVSDLAAVLGRQGSAWTWQQLLDITREMRATLGTIWNVATAADPNLAQSNEPIYDWINNLWSRAKSLEAQLAAGTPPRALTPDELTRRYQLLTEGQRMIEAALAGEVSDGK